MKRLFTASALGLLALLVLALPASAGKNWCMRDPIVRIGGTEVQILVAIPAEFEPYVTDAIEVRIRTPRKYTREVLFTDQGFNGHGEEVSWNDLSDSGNGLIPLHVEVRVKLDESDLEDEFGDDTEVPV